MFPDVGSMMVSPGWRMPSLSASSTIRRLILSFTLPPALKYSHLATAEKKNCRCLHGRINLSSLSFFLISLTYLTLESEGFRDLVDAHHWRLSNPVQNIWQDCWLDFPTGWNKQNKAEDVRPTFPETQRTRSFGFGGAPLTLESRRAGSRPWRLPGSTCSGWGGRDESTFCQD